MFNPENTGKAALTAKPLLNKMQKNYSISQGFNRGNLLNEMAKSGAYPADGLPSDSPGQICRYRIDGDKPGSKNGWVIYFPDGDGCVFGNWKTGIQATYFANKGQYSVDDFKRIRQEAKTAYIKAQNAKHMEAAKQCKAHWKRAIPANPCHAYLMKKNILSYGLKQYENRLILPVMDNDGEIISLQFISPDGTKRFKAGGKIKGGRYYIGNIEDSIEDSKIVIICEGYATGATLMEAIGLPVVVCFNAGNLLTVTSDIRRKYQAHMIIICADNDRYTNGNPGLTKAEEAAKAAFAIVAYPKNLTSGTDVNDLALEKGINAVTDFINEVLNENTF